MPLDQSPEADPDTPLAAMPLGDHLDELRGRLIRALIGLIPAAIITFYFGFDLIAWLAQPLLQAQDAMGFAPGTQVLDPTAGFSSVYLPVCLVGALLLAAPWLLFQIWQFISSGMYARERRAAYVLAPFSAVMTTAAIAFTYYVMLPVSLLFFLNFATKYPPIELSEPNAITSLLLRAYERPTELETTSDNTAADSATTAPALPTLTVLPTDPPHAPHGALWINAASGKLKIQLGDSVREISLERNARLTPRVELGAFVRFASMMMLGVAIAFQLPVIMLIAGGTGLVNAKTLTPYRKYALFVAFAMGAILTPTDLMSQFVLAVPLYLLYEFGLLLMALVDRKKKAPKDYPAET
ncbi:MAG: twin-arginine translocase subunit TatC [Algisphaera sp.]